MTLMTLIIFSFSKLVEENGCVVALDPLEKWIQHINSFKIKNIKSICSTVEDISFEENEFDAIFCRYGLWIFKDVVAVLATIRKWLKPGGKFGIISTIFTPRLHYPPVPGKSYVNTVRQDMARYRSKQYHATQ